MFFLYEEYKKCVISSAALDNPEKDTNSSQKRTYKEIKLLLIKFNKEVGNSSVKQLPICWWAYKLLCSFWDLIIYKPWKSLSFIQWFWKFNLSKLCKRRKTCVQKYVHFNVFFSDSKKYTHLNANKSLISQW